jgi:hypothetical protein
VGTVVVAAVGTVVAEAVDTPEAEAGEWVAEVVEEFEPVAAVDSEVALP